MSEMIEKVARAIIETMHGESVSDEIWQARLTDNADDRDTVMSWGRAAILAMREPSEGMDFAGQSILEDPDITHDDGRVTITEGDASAVWQAMIDTALKED